MMFSVSLVRQLKGAPLSVLMILTAAGQRVSQDYLERHTGYTDKPVSQALAYLQDLGYCDHSSSGWGLCEGEQMVLGQGVLLPAETKIETASESVVLEVANSDTIGGSRNYSDSAFKEEEVNINLSINDLTSSSYLTAQKRNNSDSVAQVLNLSGVISGIAQELSQNIQVSVGQLRAHIFEMSLHKNYTPGILVYRLRKSPAMFAKPLVWDEKRWRTWCAANQVQADFEMVSDLARDFRDPAEALDRLPLSGLSREVVEGCLWEVGDVCDG